MIDVSLSTLSNALLLQTGLQAQTGGNGLFQPTGGFLDTSHFADTLPYIAGGAGVVTAAGLGTWAIVRLWRSRNETPPPAGMTDIPPRRMAEFFAAHAGDPETVTRLCLDFRTASPDRASRKSFEASLTDTRRMIAHEINELTQTHAALENHPNAKKRELVANAIAAYRNLETFAALRAGEKVRAREDFLAKPNEVFSSILKGLNDLETYRTIVAIQFFRKAYAEGVGTPAGEKPDMEIAAAYKTMGEEASKSEARRAIRAWQRLNSAQRIVLWSMARNGKAAANPSAARDPMIAPSFLAVYLRMRNSPDLPASLSKDAAKHQEKLDELIRAEIDRLDATRALPAHVRNMNHAMVVLRRDVERKGGIHSQPSALLMTPVRVKTEGGVPTVELEVQDRKITVEPGDILITRDENYRANDASWMSPRVVKALEETPEAQKPRLVFDLTMLPSPSLGEGHKVVVDMEDRRMKEFLKSLEPYRERLLKGDSRGLIAKQIWETFRRGPEKFDKERLRKLTERGNVHSLFDVIDETGLAERAILLQIAFQYVGFRSGIEKSNVTINHNGKEVEMGLQLWVRMSMSDRGFDDAYIIHPLVAPIAYHQPNFARFVDQPSHVGAAPTSGSGASGLKPLPQESGAEPSGVRPPPLPSAARPSAATTPTAAPVMEAPAEPQETNDDDESERPTIIPVSSPAAQQRPTVPAPAPLPKAPGGSEFVFPDTSAAAPSEEPTQQINIKQLQGLAIRAELTTELRDRFRALNADDPETSQFVATITKAIFDAWDARGRQATEFDALGGPVRIPEHIVNEEMEKWLQAKEASNFPKDRADAAALRASDQGTRAEREGRAERRPLSQPPAASGAAKAGPPPLPRETREEDVQREIRNLIFRRYPALRAESMARLVAVFAKTIQDKAGNDADKRMEVLVAEVRGALKPLKSRPQFQSVFKGLLASEGIWDELREFCPAFGETTWSEALQDALQTIYAVWDKSERRLEVSPANKPLIPEEVFAEGYAEFFNLLRKRYPNLPVEVLKQTFVDNNNGPRAVRWAPEQEVSENDVIDVGPEDEIVEEVPASVAPKAPQPAPASVAPAPMTPASVAPASAPAPVVTTSEVSNVRVRPAASTVADVSARLFERYPFFVGYAPVARAMATSVVKALDAGAELGAALDVEIGNLFLHLANTPRLNAKEEAILKGIAEADLVRSLQDNYAFFRDPKRARAALEQAREIYKVWNANNRTFDGREKTRPLRVPERFLEEAMDKLINYLHKANRPLADAIAGSRVDRPMARRDSSRPPAPAAIPVSEETIFLELVDRVPEFATNKNLTATARFLAAAIYKTWLQKDPTRALERSGLGLHGFVPEATLDEKLLPFLAHLRSMKTPVTDRGAREKRGTGVLERLIQKRSAA